MYLTLISSDSFFWRTGKPSSEESMYIYKIMYVNIKKRREKYEYSDKAAESELFRLSKLWITIFGGPIIKLFIRA